MYMTTLEPPLMDPPRIGQPLYSRQAAWYGSSLSYVQQPLKEDNLYIMYKICAPN